MTVNLATGTVSGGHAQDDTLISIEDVTGSDFDDFLTGNGSQNYIAGGDGADKLDGGGGRDRLWGDDGTDAFYFYANFGNDTIWDYTLGASKDASETIYVCMGTASNLATQTGADADNGTDHVITVTFNGATAGTITLKNRTTSSTNFANLNIRILSVNTAGNCHEPGPLRIWFIDNMPRLSDGRIFMQIAANKGGNGTCKIADGSPDNTINCPPGSLISLPATSGTNGDKIAVWATSAWGGETARSVDMEVVVGGPNIPRVEASGGNGKLLVGWEAPKAVNGAINAYFVERRQQNMDGTWPTTWTETEKSASDRSHTFTGLANGTWQVRVRARNNAGDTDDATHIQWDQIRAAHRRAGGGQHQHAGHSERHRSDRGKRESDRDLAAAGLRHRRAGARLHRAAQGQRRRRQRLRGNHRASPPHRILRLLKLLARDAHHRGSHRRHELRGGDQVPQRQRRQPLGTPSAPPTRPTSRPTPPAALSPRLAAGLGGG